ncbi:hypothetical protein D9758_006328 [Tetrapyrgos nigripes]|uniref:BTB domain-containing protein n=1 Tax=Tetrapyrgos nigripes TaxID=182062 RepID=A0A8H5DAU2_9AGAR|nr:hypothetical protein D9758_006328 [Tetrapyrgos nigripes]
MRRRTSTTTLDSKESISKIFSRSTSPQPISESRLYLTSFGQRAEIFLNMYPYQSPSPPDSAQGSGFASLRRNEKYFLNGGDLFFLIEQEHFRVHRYFFERESPYFKAQLAVPAAPGAPRQGASITTAIILDDVRSADFAKFLWVFYNPRYSLYDASIADWVVILDLAYKWGFQEVKSLCVRELEKLHIPDVDKIVIYHKYDIDRRLLMRQYTAVCERETPLTIQECTDLGLETTVKIFRARESVRATRTPSGIHSPVTASPVELQDIVKGLFELPEQDSLTSPVDSANAGTGAFQTFQMFPSGINHTGGLTRCMKSRAQVLSPLPASAIPLNSFQSVKTPPRTPSQPISPSPLRVSMKPLQHPALRELLQKEDHEGENREAIDEEDDLLSDVTWEEEEDAEEHTAVDSHSSSSSPRVGENEYETIYDKRSNNSPGPNDDLEDSWERIDEMVPVHDIDDDHIDVHDVTGVAEAVLDAAAELVGDDHGVDPSITQETDDTALADASQTEDLEAARVVSFAIESSQETGVAEVAGISHSDTADTKEVPATVSLNDASKSTAQTPETMADSKAPLDDATRHMENVEVVDFGGPLGDTEQLSQDVEGADSGAQLDVTMGSTPDKAEEDHATDMIIGEGEAAAQPATETQDGTVDEAKLDSTEDGAEGITPMENTTNPGNAESPRDAGDDVKAAGSEPGPEAAVGPYEVDVSAPSDVDIGVAVVAKAKEEQDTSCQTASEIPVSSPVDPSTMEGEEDGSTHKIINPGNTVVEEAKEAQDAPSQSAREISVSSPPNPSGEAANTDADNPNPSVDVSPPEDQTVMAVEESEKEATRKMPENHDPVEHTEELVDDPWADLNADHDPATEVQPTSDEAESDAKEPTALTADADEQTGAREEAARSIQSLKEEGADTQPQARPNSVEDEASGSTEDQSGLTSGKGETADSEGADACSKDQEQESGKGTTKRPELRVVIPGEPTQDPKAEEPSKEDASSAADAVKADETTFGTKETSVKELPAAPGDQEEERAADAQEPPALNLNNLDNLDMSIFDAEET